VPLRSVSSTILEAQVVITPSAVSHDLLVRLSEARLCSDALFRIVREDFLYERPIPERHRIVFYIGHLEAFDWNLLANVLGLKSLDPDFDRLFAFGIDPVGGGLPDDQASDWPSLQAIRGYVSRVRAHLDDRLTPHRIDANDNLREGLGAPTLLNVAIEHRLMHLETLAYMFHQLPLDRKMAPANAPAWPSGPLKHRMCTVPAGETRLGLSRDSGIFGWDNEFEIHRAHVPSFEINQYKITNRQYLDFMHAGGYDARPLWSDDAWAWTKANGISHPVFWKAAGANQAGAESIWLYRTMFRDIPLPLDWPVYVSHAEANAYARWAGQALPTEEQWHRAAYGTPMGVERRYPWGNADPHPHLGNFDFQRWDPTPVNAFPCNVSAFGVEDMLGNGWEWTSTVFAPFPGFEPFPFYLGYSANFFDGKHFVMKGGSARTAGCMLRPTFRNWFQGHYQYVYAGFRCVSH
jgi:gamma-glutamyl hercynylcysteine S-oxide synthase